MNQDQIEELAALDALGALDGGDLALWEKESKDNPVVLLLRDEFSAAVAQLALLAPAATAPSILRQRIMEKTFGGSTARSSEKQAGRHFGYAAWAAAAAVIFLVLVGALATTEQKASIVVRDARVNPQNLQITLQGYGDYAGAKAHVLWDSGQRGWYVQAGGLPSLPATHAYRVWAVDAEGAVHDCGALALREGGLARTFVQPGETMSSMQGFAVTIEPVGSTSPVPTSPAVLTSALQG